MSDTDPLVEIEEAIDAVAPLSELRKRLEALAHLADAPGEDGIRYLIARGIVENRGELPQSALATFQQARDAAIRYDAIGQMARISREIARVRSWSGDIAGAAMELLRSVAEVEQSNATLTRERAGSGMAGQRPTRDDVARRGRQEVRIRVDRAATVAEIGRLDIEAGRYEAAIAALDEAARQAPGTLPPREAGRIAYNRCESWFGLGRTDRCRALIDETAPLFSRAYPRDLFRVRLLKARCLLQDGDHDEAGKIAREAVAALGGDDDFYEKGAEWLLFDGLVKERDDPDAAIAALRQARLRFADDNLPRHEVEAAIHLARILAKHDHMPEAETTIAEALARAGGLPALADQVRTAAYSFWAPAKIADLAGENALQPGAPGGDMRFLVLATLGSGGFGTVQRAVDMATGEQVAIKRLKAGRGRSKAARELMDTTVRREVETARKVPPRFAARTRYLNVSEAGDVVLVQDFVDGPTLRKVLAEGTADLARRLAIAAQLARGVAALHAHEVAHRDLKPENVILRGGSQPVLIDLGLAALMGTSDVFSGMGTPGYAPPEQWKPGTRPAVFGSEDVYALGRVIAELGGAPPPDNRWKARLKARLGLSISRAPDVDGMLRKLLKRMTDEDPAKRDVDLGELAGALDEAAARAG